MDSPQRSRDPNVVMTGVDLNDTEDITREPSQGKSSAEFVYDDVQSSLPSIDELSVQNEEPRRLSLRFSIVELMAITGFAAIGLAGGYWLKPELFAGLIGFGALVAVFAFTTMLADVHVPRVAWWCFLVTYLMAALSAMLRS